MHTQWTAERARNTNQMKFISRKQTRPLLWTTMVGARLDRGSGVQFDIFLVIYFSVCLLQPPPLHFTWCVLFWRGHGATICYLSTMPLDATLGPPVPVQSLVICKVRREALVVVDDDNEGDRGRECRRRRTRGVKIKFICSRNSELRTGHFHFNPCSPDLSAKHRRRNYSRALLLMGKWWWSLLFLLPLLPLIGAFW